MSLYKLKAVWTAKLNERIDDVVVGKVDNGGENRIVTGSAEGKLRVHEMKESLVLEQDLGAAILQLALGRFLPQHESEEKIGLAVLHPNRLSVYTLEGYQLISQYHIKGDNFYSMSCGPFGKSARDCLLIETRDTEWFIYEQETFAHSIQFRNQNPGIVIYSPELDFMISQIDLDLQCFRYDTLLDAKTPVPQWFKHLAQRCVKALLAKENTLIVLGETTSFLISLIDGAILGQTLLDCRPLTAVSIGQDTFMLSATDASIRIMDSIYIMKWRATGESVSRRIAYDPDTGHIIAVDNNGVLSVCYLGTSDRSHSEPLNIDPKVLAGLEAQSARLEARVKAQHQTATKVHPVIQVNLNLSKENAIECHIVGEHKDPLRITFMLPHWCQTKNGDRSFALPSLCGEAILKLQLVAPRLEIAPSSTVVRVVLSYKEASAPKIITSQLQLPARLACRGVTADASKLTSGVSITLKTDAVLSSADFVGSAFEAAPSKALAQYEFSDSVRSTIASSSKGYRVQASEAAYLWLPSYELTQALSKRHNATFAYNAELPLLDLLTAIEKYQTLHSKVRTTQTKLKENADHLNKVQAHFEQNLKHSIPASLAHLEVILKRSQRRLLETVNELDSVLMSRQKSQSEICALLSLIVLLTEASQHQPAMRAVDFEPYFNLFTPVDDMLAQWQENTEASVALLLDTHLRRGTKEKSETASDRTSAISGLKRQIAVAFDRFSAAAKKEDRRKDE